MRPLVLTILLLISLNVAGQISQERIAQLSGSYLGQTPPGTQSKVFAPGFVSTESGELNSVFTRDGSEFYFSRRGVPGKQSKIMVTRLENNIWTEPEPIGFSTSYSDIDLSLSPNGQSMVFCSNRPHQKGDGVKTDHDFWISKREGKKWSEPQLFAKEALSEFEDYFPIVTYSGNLYFNSQRGGRGTNDIYCSRHIDGRYSAAEKLPEPINTQYREFDAFVNPDEKMILFSSERPGGFGGSDIYVSFKRPDGSWSEPKNLGNDINSAQSEYGATLSPDGKYFFYTSGKNGNEDIFWVSAKIIEAFSMYWDLKNSKTVSNDFKVSELNNLGYELLNAGCFAEAIEIFILNTELNPTTSNCWNSLGEAYMLAGQRKKASEAYQRNSELNPNNLSAKHLAYNLKNYKKSQVDIPMRDGVKLKTIVYSPVDQSQPYPFLMRRTPYGIGPYGENQYKFWLGTYLGFAEKGYIFVYQDVRGKYMSEGEFIELSPLKLNKSMGDVDESTDTYDTIEWLLKNIPNHNGKVGMYGFSYPAFYSLMGAVSKHQALVAISPQAPPADVFIGDDFHRNGAFYLLESVNFFNTNGVIRSQPTENPPPAILEFPSNDLFSFFLGTGPLKNWNEKYFKGQMPTWNLMMEHGSYDSFWQARNILPHLNGLKTAVLNVGGWYDAEDLYGPLNVYAAIEKNNPGISNLMVMGPWSHGGWTRNDGDRLGEIRVNSTLASEFYQKNVELPFFEHFLKGKGNWAMPEALVFDTGLCRWDSLTSWPPTDVIAKTLFLGPGNYLGEVVKSIGKNNSFDEFISDPAMPVPHTGKMVTGWDSGFMTADQRFAARRSDVLHYQTEPLKEDMSVVGEIEVELAVSTTGTDADWFVKIIDVYPDNEPDFEGISKTTHMSGYQSLVRLGVMRGKFRNSFDKPEPFVPGKITGIKFNLDDICHTFKKGHSLMVQVQSTCFPLFDINPQKYTDIYRADASDFQKSTHRVYFDAENQSKISINIHLPAYNVFTVMEMVTNIGKTQLWPNFLPSEIPVLVFDSIDTWLFHSQVMPDGFSVVPEHPNAYRFSGQHPLVRGNSIVRMGDTWVATSVFSSYARRTGEKYSAKDLAGIIIHEQFHIFSRNRHPRWVPNDGLLLLYPAETQDALFLRRIEKEAFKRAVTSEKPEDICGWVREGLKYRDQRMSSLPPVFRLYEPELQRTEGLSDYIEKTARGLDPLNASEITDGIAPAGVRDLGYVEGRWIAMILDKINPGWKTILEASDSLYLENILKNVVSDLPCESKSLSSTDIEKIKTETHSDLLHWREKQKREIEQFDTLPGFRIEINASSKPLNIWIFEPLEIEILDDRSVFHRVIFSAGNEAGSLRILNLPSITGFDNSLRVTSMQIHGLSKGPEINEKEKTVKLKDGSSTLDLKYSRITVSGSLYKVEL